MTFYKSSVFKYLTLCLLVWAAVFYASIESTVAIWLRSETFAHCFIILPICIYLIKQKWAELNNAQLAPTAKALVFAIPVLAIWLFGNLAQVLVIEQFATFAMLPIMIWCLMGSQVARILLFTSFFWLFSVPAGEFLIPQLQELTADITVWSLQMTGIPVYREGLYIAIPTGLFEVAVACSGIRYLIASFTLGTLFAYLNYNGLKKRTIFILFSIVLPLLANGIRAYGIVIIAHLSDMKYATGVDHLVYGWVFFGVVILIMFTVGGRWADPLPEKVEQKNPNGTSLQIKQRFLPIIVIAAVLAAALSYKAAFENMESDFTPNLDVVFNDSQAMKDDSWLPIFVNPSKQVSASEDGFDYFYAYYNANIQGRELINGANHLFNIERWSIVKSEVKENYRIVEIIDNFGRKRILAYSYVTPWHMSHKSVEIKLTQAVQALLGQPQIGYLFVVSKAIKTKSDEEQLKQHAKAKFSIDLKETLLTNE